MNINDNLKSVALDLTKVFPRSPRVTLAGYVIAARAIDKGRAELVGTSGEYHYDCSLDNTFFSFAGIIGAELKEFLSTGADDAAVEVWILEHATKRPKIEIVKWNNDLRYKRISELPDEGQLFMETYIPECVPTELIPRIDYWFDVYDAEEKRLG